MSNYDFLSLDDKEFEQLALHLLGAQEDIVYERFKPGKDGGIDGRFFSSNQHTIVQCKHWARSGFAPLLRTLRNEELAKVQRLKPKRYVIMTSVPLSPGNKAEIRALFTPYIVNDSDVIGSESLNDLLSLHPDIERRTTKLWLHSAFVLSQLNSLALLGRSAFVLAEIRRKRARYVEISSHGLGISRLLDNHVILITGEPGVGKTTLAEQLCLDHVLNGFELCAAAKDVDELEASYREETKQVFYFDDFLGRTFLEAIGRHEDSQIVGFIKRIRSDRSKRLILTSRTTILNRGKSLTDLFRIENVDRHELELQVGQLSQLDKARILHSCIWHSALGPDHAAEIVRESKYMYVIAHRNFNPRLISFITDPMRLTSIKACDYWKYITSKLENPADIWGDVYDQQMKDAQRILLLLVVTNGGDISEKELSASYGSYLATPNGARIQGDTDYYRNIQILIGSLLNRTLDAKNQSAFDLFNPSVSDFALPRIAGDGELLSTLALTLKTKQMIRYLSRLIRRGKIPRTTAKTVGSRFSNDVLTTGCTVENVIVQVEMLEIAAEQNPDAEETKSAVVQLLTKIQSLDDGQSFLANVSPLLRYGVTHELFNIDFILIFLDDLENYSFSLDELREFFRLANGMSSDADRNTLLYIFKPVALDVISEVIDEDLKDQDILEGFMDVGNMDEAAEKVWNAIADLCADIGVDASHFEIDAIQRHVDIRSIIEGNIRRASREDDFNDIIGDTESVPREIHDLFSMDLPPLS